LPFLGRVRVVAEDVAMGQRRLMWQTGGTCGKVSRRQDWILPKVIEVRKAKESNWQRNFQSSDETLITFLCYSILCLF